jgi:hypothetical protein
MVGKQRQGLGCGLDIIGCGSDLDNRADRSSRYSILRCRLVSRINDRKKLRHQWRIKDE